MTRRAGCSLLFVAATATLLCAPSGLAFAQDRPETEQASGTAAQQPDTVLVVRTGSPRQTLQSWLEHTRRAEILTERKYLSGFR